MDENKYGKLRFAQGTINILPTPKDFNKNIEFLKEKIREFFNLKNVNFLFGSGTSSGAIPTMSQLYENLTFQPEEKDLEDEFQRITEKVGNNLEQCLNVMYSARTYYNGLYAKNEGDAENIENWIKIYNNLIKKIEKHIFSSINIKFKEANEINVLEYYKTFYQKLALRSKDNSRIRIFTTNNDLYNETALDALNIHYINGFSGGLRKYFNPAIFNYTWSKRMDTSIDKYEPVENIVYLYKIHGSVNWRETDVLTNNYFEIEEVVPSEIKSDGSVLIYPTPTKQDKSLGSPYIDLFREFQNKLLEPHSVLFIIGYSFSDRHVNDIIYRALATNSTINVVIFGSQPSSEERKNKPIFFINDNRIFTISGQEYSDSDLKKKKINGTVHYFNYIVNNLLPNLDAFRKEDNLLNKFVEQLKKEKHNEDR